MSSEVVDVNIVEIQFDNQKFVENVSETQKSVEKLKDSLQFDSNSFDKLEKAAANVDLSKLADNVQSLSDRFSTFGIVGMTAIQRITNEVMTLGGKLASLLAKPWQQIITGGTTRAANIAKAKFQLEGIFGKEAEGVAKLAMAMDADAEKIKELTGYTEDLVVAMDAANYAVADTAYGLDSAAKAASVLATSGTDVTHFEERFADASGKMRTEMQVALRAISGVAAMANTEYDNIAQIFERISGNGRVMARDWISFSGYGIGAAAVIRDYLNKIGETTNATEQDIRDMASKGKISFETLAMAMDDAYGEHAKDANNTFTGALSNMKFALSKIGADFIGPLRNKAIPLFNDLRLSINQVRKALQFKVKIPGLEEEISIVEAFTRVITNLANKLHDLGARWMGGQDAFYKGITGLAEATGIGFDPMKKLFEELKDGSKSVNDAIEELSSISEDSTIAVDKVLQRLGETLEKTDDEIREMCRNGEISFEDFKAAASDAFGNTVWDKRVEQEANLLQNLIHIVINLGNTIATFVGPVVEAFFDVFLSGGVSGIIDATGAVASFTDKLKLSYQSQRNLYTIANKIFKIVKSFVSFSFRIVRSIVRILEKFAPLVDYLLEFGAIIATVIEYLVDAVLNSNLLTGSVELLGSIFGAVGSVIVNILRIILALAGPAFNLIGSVFSILAKGIMSIDLSFLNKIALAIGNLFYNILNNGLINGVVTLVAGIMGAIASLFSGINAAFDSLHDMLNRIAAGIYNVIVMIVGFFAVLGNRIKNAVVSLLTFLQKNFLKIVALIQEVLVFSAAYTLLHFGTTINDLLDSIAGKNKVEQIKAVAQAIKSFAEAMLIITAAAWAIAYIPEDRFKRINWGLLALFIMVGLITGALIWYRLHLMKLKTALTKDKAFANLIVSVNNLVDGLRIPLIRLVNSIRNAITLRTLGIVILEMAAAIWVFIQSMKQLASMDDSDIERGLITIGLMMIGMLAVMKGLQYAAGGTGGAMMGAAVAMLAFIVVLKAMVGIIDQYSNMEYGLIRWTLIIFRIATALGVMVAAASILGHYVKANGFAMMGAAISMLAFIVILKALTDIIKQYAEIDWGTMLNGMLKIAAVLFVFTVAIRGIAEVLGGESSITASIKDGFSSKRNTQNFLGAILSMLAMCVVLKSVASIAKSLSEVGILSFIGTLILIVTAMGSLAYVIQSSKGMDKGSTVGLIAAMALMAVITASIAGMTLLDPKSMIGAAVSLTMVIGALVLAIKAMNSITKEIDPNTILTMVAVLGAIGIITLMLAELANNDWKSIFAAGSAISRVLMSVSFAMRTLQNVQAVDMAVLTEMAGIVIVLGMIVSELAQIKDVDPVSLFTITACLSALALVMSTAVRILSDFKGNGTNLIAPLITMAGSLSILAVGLAIAGNVFKGSETGIIALSAALLILTPLIFALMFCIGIMSRSIRKDEIATGIIGLGAIMTFISAFAWAMAEIAQIGDVTASVFLLQNLGMAMLKLVPAIVAFALIAGVLGLLMTKIPSLALGMVGGFIALAAILAAIGSFTAALSDTAQVGDITSTVLLLNVLGDALTSLLPFIIVMELVSTVLGIALPLMALGIIGFRYLMSVIIEFVASLSIIASYGNVSSTVLVLTNLASAMNTMKDFLIEFMSVLTVLGAFGALTSVGIGLFSSVLGVMVTFVATLSKLSAAGSIQPGIAALNAMILAMHSLMLVFEEITMVGAKAPQVVAGLITIMSALGLMMTASLFIGTFGVLNNLIVSGMNVLLILAQTFGVISSVMSSASLEAITTFITIINLIDTIKVSSIIKLISTVAVLSALATPIGAIGAISNSIYNGVAACVTMISGLSSIVIAAHALDGMNVDVLADVADKLIGIAALVTTSGLFASAATMISDFSAATNEMITVADEMFKRSGEFYAAGIAEGMTDQDSRTILTAAAITAAALLSSELDKALGIASPAKDGIEDGHYEVAGIGVGMTDDYAQTLISQATSTLSENIGTEFINNGTPIMELAGQSLGNSFLNSLGVTIEEGSIATELFDAAGDFSWTDLVYGKKGSNGKAKKNKTSKPNRNASNSGNFIRNFQNEREFLEWQNQHEETVKDVKEEDLAWNDYSNTMEKLLKEILGDGGVAGALGDVDVSDLASSLSDVGSASSTASKNIDKLTQKIDDLMEKYEDRFEDAKERANKDLFKGVDKQGDDFLDKIKDIMDEYENIYTKAVERTNGQDLFAEVNEDDESFAPETLLNNLEDQVDQINELNTIISSLGGRIADQNLNAAIANMDVDDLPQLRALYRMNDSQLADYERLYQKKVNANQNKIQNELSGELSQLTGRYTNIATYIADDATTNTLIANLQAQVDQLNEYNMTVASLMNRIQDVNLREAIANMGVESLDELKELNSMTDTQLDQYIALYNQKIAAGATSIEHELSTQLSALLGTPIDIRPFYDNYDGTMESVINYLSGHTELGDNAGEVIANQIGKGLSKGMTSETNKSSMTTSGSTLTNSLADGLTDKDAMSRATANASLVIDEILAIFNGHDEDFRTSGAEIIHSLLNGIDFARRSDQIFGLPIHDVMNEIINKMNSHMNQFEMIGHQIVYGIKKGIEDKAPLVYSAATSLAVKAAGAARDKLKIKSPSRVFMEIGKFVDEGFAIGLKEYAGLAEEEASNMATGSVSAVQDAINQLSGLLDGSIDVNPVITPTLDLSDVNARSAALADMFNGRQIAVQAQADEQQAAMMSQLGNILAEQQNAEPKSVNFTQNNYSPKALSNAEIYRQSKNAFSRLANAVT